VRFLVDASLSPRVARSLADAGHDSVHVGDVMPLTAGDEEVFVRASDEARVLIAADTDFAELLARRGTATPSLILWRRRTRRRPAEQAALILAQVADLEQDLGEGAIIVIEEARVRVRALPIDGA
jgi:predicted nuclease of predicted toxin-antitoxin system